jgi:hypothetical protein
MKHQRTVLTVIGLLVPLGFAATPISKFFDEFASLRNMIGYELIWWTLVALVLLYVRYVKRRCGSSSRIPRVQQRRRCTKKCLRISGAAI